MIRNRAKLSAVFISAFFLGMWADPAIAGPVPAAIAALAVAAKAYITWTAVLKISLQIAIATGLSYLQASLAGKPQRSLGIVGKLQTGGDVPRSFVPGNYCTAGSLAFAATWSTPNVAPNAYLVYVIALSDLPVSALKSVWVNGVKAVYPAGVLTAQGYPLLEYRKAGVDYLWVKFYDGSQVAADAYLVDKFGTAQANYSGSHKYDSDRIGTGVAYAIVTARLKPDDPSFTGFPAYKFELDGIKQYDPRLDTTAGGSGSHRYNDPATWAFTKNPALTIYNILHGFQYAGEWFYGLQDLNAVRLPTASWFAAMNECELLVDDAVGGTEFQFLCGAEVPVSAQPIDIIGEFQKACNGRIAEIGGSYKIRVGASGTAVMTLTDSDIIITEEQTFSSVASLASLINGVTATYPEPVEGWAMKDAPARYDAALEVDDGNRRLVSDVIYATVPFPNQVQRLMKSALEEARKFRSHVLVLPPSYWPVEPLDVLSFSSTRNSYTAKKFDIKAVQDLGNLDVLVVISEVDPADYTFVPGDYEPYTVVPLTLDLPATQAIVDWAVAPVTVLGDGGRSDAGIKLFWNPDVEDVDGVQFEVRLASDGSLVLSGETDAWDKGSIVLTENILSATAYEVRGRYRPASERETSWSSWLPVTTSDIRIQEWDVGIAAIVTAALADTAVTAQKILDGSITLSKHASGLTPIGIGDALPSTGNFEGRHFHLMVPLPGKLYRYTNGAWSAAVATVDLLGTIDTAQIADAAITAQKLGAAAVVAGKIAALAVTPESIASLMGMGNLVQNSSFERHTAGMPAGWVLYTSGGGSAGIGGPGGNVYHGDYFVRVDWTGAATNKGIMATNDTVAPGRANSTMVYSFWAKTNAGGGEGHPVKLTFQDVAPDAQVTLLQPNLIAATWQRYAFRVTWGATPGHRPIISVDTPTASGLFDVDALQIETGSVLTAYAPAPFEILSDSILATHITDNAVTTPKIIAGAIVTAKIAAGAVTANELAANSVIAGKIAAGTIVAADIAADTITGAKIAAGAISSSELAAGSVIAGKIAAGTIVAADIAALTITADQIGAATITAAKMVADTLTAGTIAAGAIGASELAAAAVVAGKVSAGAIGADEIAANAIVASKIAANTIIADHIIANAITTSKINDGAVSNYTRENISYTSTDADISTWVTLETIVITPSGKPADITGRIIASKGVSDNAYMPSFGWRVMFDGGLAIEGDSQGASVGPSYTIVHFTHFHSPTAASHTYLIQMNRHTAGSPLDDDDYPISGHMDFREIMK